MASLVSAKRYVSSIDGITNGERTTLETLLDRKTVVADAVIGCTPKELKDIIERIPLNVTAGSNADYDHELTEKIKIMVADQLKDQLRDHLREWTSFASNTQTRADAMKRMIGEGNYKLFESLTNTMQDYRVDWWPTGGSVDFPGVDTGETDICQPFVTTMLNLFVSGQVTVKQVEEGKAKGKGRGKAKAVETERVVTVKNIPRPSAYTDKRVGKRSSDVSFHDGAGTAGVMSTTMLAEVRGGGEGDFPIEYVGQLTDGMIRLMQKQPFRWQMYGVLTDGCRFLFVQCLSDATGATIIPIASALSCVVSALLQILFGLMCAQPTELGFLRISVFGYSITDFLGSGAFSVVLKAERTSGVEHETEVSKEPAYADCTRAAQTGGRKRARHQSSAERADSDALPVAIKIFCERNRELRDVEAEVLDRMKKNSNVPSVVQSLDVRERPAIILSPAGDTVLPVKNGVRANKTDFVQLLQVLFDAHRLHICHRDVKPQNIFKDRNGRVILSDWSSAGSSQERANWAGTRFYYDNRSARGEKDYPRPADDLVALVRSVYVMYTNEKAPNETTVHAMEASPLWREALRCARNCEYDSLRDFFDGL